MPQLLLEEKELQDCRSTLRSMPSTRKTEPRLFFITTLRFARYGDSSSEPAETRSLLLEPLLVVWGTVAHLSLKRRCSQVKKLLTSAATTPDLQRPIFRKYIDLFIAHNRTLTLNWPFNWLGAWEFWNLPLFFETYFLLAFDLVLAWTFATTMAPFGLYSSLTFWTEGHGLH